jgi:hypothetical protein
MVALDLSIETLLSDKGKVIVHLASFVAMRINGGVLYSTTAHGGRLLRNIFGSPSSVVNVRGCAIFER